MDLNKKALHICCMCGAKAELKLDNGNWICWMCAQIQGELANL